MEEPISDMDHFQPDPLLKPGAFIDPTPSSNGAPNIKPSFFAVDPVVVVESSQPFDQKGGVTVNGTSKPQSSAVNSVVEASLPSDQKVETPPSARPDWLPPGWLFFERVRASGSSAGSRDKYYQDPVTQRRFRSKKEVLYFLETGTTKKRKNADSDADNTPDSKTPKRKKSETKAKNYMKNFNFDDVPAKVKWSLTDIYEGTWRPLINGADRVPESTKQEWSAAFTYLALQNAGKTSLLW